MTEARHQRRARERLLLRYLTALEQGDLETLAEILHLAETDASLSLQLQELHLALASEPGDSQQYALASMNGNHANQHPGVHQNGASKGVPIMQAAIPVDIHPQSLTLKTSRNLSAALALAAAVITMLFMGMTLAVQPSIPGSQPATPQLTLGSLQPINGENVAELQPLVTLGTGWINSFAWSPDGKTLALGTATGIYLHSTADLNAEPVLFGGQALRASNVTYSSDGQALAAIRDGSIWLWDTGTGAVLNRITDPQVFGWLTVSGDASRVAAVICAKANEYLYHVCDESVERIWDAKTGEVLQSFPVPQRFEVSSTALNPDMTLLAFVGEDAREIYLADVTSGDISLVIQEPLHLINALAFSSDGSRLALGYETVNTGESQIKVAHVSDLLANKLTSNGAAAAPSRRTNFDPSKLFTVIGFRKNDSEILALHFDGSYVIWHEDGEVVEGKPVPSEKGLVIIDSGSDPFNPDGNRMAVPYRNGWLKLHDLATGAEIASLNSYDTQVTNVSFDRNGDLMATNGFTGNINLWDLSLPEPVHLEVIGGEVDGIHTNASRASLNFDGHLVAYQLVSDTGHSSGIYVRDLATGTTTRATGGNDLYGGYNAVFDAADNLVFPLNLNTIIRWTAPDQLTQFEPQTPDGGRAFGGSGIAIVSPDGRWIARRYCDRGITSFSTKCDAATAGIWDAQTGKAVLYLNAPTTLAGISADLAFSDDGHTLALTNCSEMYSQPLNGGTSTLCATSYVLVWDVSSLYADASAGTPEPDPTQPQEPAVSLMPDQTNYWTVRLSPARTGDTTLMALTSLDGVEIWRLDLAKGTAEPVNHLKQEAYIAQFDPTGRLLAVGLDGITTLYGISK